MKIVTWCLFYFSALQCLLCGASGRSLVSSIVAGRQEVANEECVESCRPVLPFLGNRTLSCQPETCCSNSFAESYFDCLLCIADFTGNPDFSNSQQMMDVYTANCFEQGFPVPIFTFPGQNSNRPSANPPRPSLQPAPTTTESAPQDPAPTVIVSIAPSGAASSGVGAEETATPQVSAGIKNVRSTFRATALLVVLIGSLGWHC